MRRAAALALLLPSLACAPPPPLAIEVAPGAAPADGVTATTLTARLGTAVAGAVVQWTATGGLLAQSATAIEGDTSTNALIALEERELGAEVTRTVVVTARVVLTSDDEWEATAHVVFAPPADGPPLVLIEADPPGADADGQSAVEVRVRTRRLPAGAQVQLTTTAGALSAEAIDVDAQGAGAAILTAPDAPGEAVIEARAGDVAATAHALFVAPGAPRYDLGGTFVQIGAARVRLTSGALTPNPQCVVAPSYVKVELAQDGLDLHATYTTCHVTFPPVTSIAGTVTNEAPATFYDAVPIVAADVTLASPALGVAYEPPPSVVVVGAALADPAADALPTEADDARVRDDDGDGEPGVTVVNSLGGAQHIVYRNTGSARGRVRSSVRIVGDALGDLVAATETSVFGLGGAFLPAVEGLPSVVEIVRIDGAHGAVDADADGDGAITCAEVVEVAAAQSTVPVPDTPFDCGGIP